MNLSNDNGPSHKTSLCADFVLKEKNLSDFLPSANASFLSAVSKGGGEVTKEEGGRGGVEGESAARETYCRSILTRPVRGFFFLSVS